MPACSVNDVLVAHRPGGYSDFSVQIDHLLRFGGANEVKVEARAHDDSRWYSGGGIYRSVWLLQGERPHLVPGGLQVVRLRSTTTWRWWRSARPCGTSPLQHRAPCFAWRYSIQMARSWPGPRRR